MGRHLPKALSSRGRSSRRPGGAGRGDLSKRPSLEESWGQASSALARPLADSCGLPTAVPGAPNFAGVGGARAGTSRALPPPPAPGRARRLPPRLLLPQRPGRRRFPARWPAGCRAHCLIPRRRVPGSPMCAAVCVTDGASGACEGTGVSVVLRGASAFVESSLYNFGASRGGSGSRALRAGPPLQRRAPPPRPARGLRAPWLSRCHTSEALGAAFPPPVKPRGVCLWGSFVCRGRGEGGRMAEFVCGRRRHTQASQPALVPGQAPGRQALLQAQVSGPGCGPAEPRPRGRRSGPVPAGPTAPSAPAWPGGVGPRPLPLASEDPDSFY